MKKAFTLIELLIVIAIIAILATVVFVNLNSARNRAKDAQVKSDLSELSKALEVIKVDRDLDKSAWGDLNTSSSNDNNITRWLDVDGNRLVSNLPSNPNNKSPLNGHYRIRIIDSGSYALLGDLSAKNEYWCVHNGSGREITASSYKAAQNDCDG